MIVAVQKARSKCGHLSPNTGSRFAIKIDRLILFFRFPRICARYLSSPLQLPNVYGESRAPEKKISEGVEIQNKPLRKLHVMKDRLRKAFTFLPLMATGLGLREILQRETPHIPFFFPFLFFNM